MEVVFAFAGCTEASLLEFGVARGWGRLGGESGYGLALEQFAADPEGGVFAGDGGKIHALVAESHGRPHGGTAGVEDERSETTLHPLRRCGGGNKEKPRHGQHRE